MPESARDRDLLGGQIDEELTALVLTRPVALSLRQELVGHHTPRDPAGVKDARDATSQQVHVGDHAALAADAGLHPVQQLAVRACTIPSKLVDREPLSPRLHLLLELEVLRHHTSRS